MPVMQGAGPRSQLPGSPDNLTQEPALLSLRRAAHFLGLPSPRSVYLHIRNRNLPFVPVKIGNRWFIRRRDLFAFLESPPMPCAGKGRS